VALTLIGGYNDLPDYVIFAVLLFYILPISGLLVLRRTRPDTGPSDIRFCRRCASPPPG
jgi:amino acid transporter